MVDYRIVKKIWKTNRTDVIPLFATFLLCLYDIAIGIISGIAVAMLMLFYRMVLPRIDARQKEVSVVKINGGLSYVGIDYVIAKVEEVSILSDVLPEMMIVDCSNMSEVDYTVSQGFLQIVRDLEENEIKVCFSHVQKHVKTVLIDAGVRPQLFSNDYLDEHPDVFESSKTEISIELSSDEHACWLSAV